MSAILIVDDEPRITAFIARGLNDAGYTAEVAADGPGALALLTTRSFDLVVLDVGLPGIDGFGVLAELRSRDPSIPVIMLTARSASADVVAGLDQGADDYLTKPFRFDELVARIRARLRSPGLVSDTELRHMDLVLDLRTRRIQSNGNWHDLSAREFALAEEFLRHPDQVLSRSQLLSRVWGLDFDPGSNVVDVYVRYLRAKVGATRIETVRGMGYRLR